MGRRRDNKEMKRIIKRAVRKAAPQLVDAVQQLRRIEDKVNNLEHKMESAYPEGASQHDFRLDKLKALIKEVEPYQPTYAISGILKNPARDSEDRCRTIEQYLGNPASMRMLDIGSSLGYVCYYFADRGAHCEGWEANVKNAEVSRMIGEINGIHIDVKTKRFDEDTVKTIPQGHFDVAFILSVAHHIIYYNGLEYTQKLMKELTQRVPVIIMELAKKGEDPKLFWDEAQPDDELAIFDLVKDDVTIKKIGDFGNHLSNKTRPLYVITSKKSLKVNGHTYAYDHKRNEAYAGSPMVYSESIRRYYFADKYIVKEYDFKDGGGRENMRQIIAEIDNLLHIEDVHGMPKLLDFEISQNGARVVVGRQPGTLLSEIIELPDVSRPDLVLLAKEILTSLVDLEKHGLHHNDVRSWNVLFDGKQASLIDYGLVSARQTDDDIVSLLWLLVSVLKGEREGYALNKQLPDAKLFSDDPALKRLYAAVAKGERSPSKLLRSLTKTGK
jgi:O-antigen chain-terminating methyltransferase